MTVRTRVLATQEVALCFVRKWWRPVTCIGIAGGAVVNLVIIPLVNWQPVDLTAASAYVAAATAAFSVRAFEKWRGVHNA